MKEPQCHCLRQIKKHYASLSEVARRIADRILKDPEACVRMSIKELSHGADVSEGSVINFATRLGYSGYTEMKLSLAQDTGKKRQTVPDEIPPPDRPKRALRTITDNAIRSFEDTYEIITDEEFEAAANILMDASKRIDVYGVGSSAMIAEDAAFRLMRIGLPAYSLTDALICPAAAYLLDQDCAAVCISYTGHTSEMIRAIENAKSRGSRTLCITAYVESPLAQLCDVALVVRSKESEQQRQAVASRLTQQLLIDGLCAYISSKRESQSLTHLEHLADAFGAHYEKE